MIFTLVRRWLFGGRRHPTSAERYGHSTTRMMAVVEAPRDPRSSTTRMMTVVR